MRVQARAGTINAMDPKDYIQLLKKTGDILARLHDDELRRDVHPSVAILALEGPFLYAIAAQPPAPTSGLVELQRWLGKLEP